METSSQAKSLPKILTFSEIKFYAFSAVFTIGAVFVPWMLHQFDLLGPKFLPMHYFVLIAGFLFGWRTGFMVGILSPLISYSLSHLPPIAILPETILELAVYGIVIGFLREKNINILPALIFAMVLGRAARFLFVAVFHFQTNPLQYFQMSLQGIALQVILIPLTIFLLQKFLPERTK